MTIEPNPINPIGWLVIVLLGVLGYFMFAPAAVSSTAQVVPPMPGRPARPEVSAPSLGAASLMPANAELLSVEVIDVLRESSTAQISVSVSGYWPNGCNAEPQIVTAVDGNNIQIAVFRVIPIDVMCTMVIQAADFQIDVTDLLVQEGLLRAGQYTVDVNGVVITTRF